MKKGTLPNSALPSARLRVSSTYRVPNRVSVPPPVALADVRPECSSTSSIVCSTRSDWVISVHAVHASNDEAQRTDPQSVHNSGICGE